MDRDQQPERLQVEHRVTQSTSLALFCASLHTRVVETVGHQCNAQEVHEQLAALDDSLRRPLVQMLKMALSLPNGGGDAIIRSINRDTGMTREELEQVAGLSD